MQLNSGNRPPSLRGRLSAAACLLLASGAPAAARAAAPKWQFEGTGLLYREQNRVSVVEPTARITRLFPDGQTLSATLGIDAVTGASPTGAIPSNTVQTTTTPSGRVHTSEVGLVPTNRFSDARLVLDLGWTKPFGNRITTSLGTHVSQEKDYRSFGADGRASVAFMDRLSTLTVGGSYDRDSVFPRGGTREPFTDGTVIMSTSANPKRVATGLVGLSRVLTRRWMLGLDVSRTHESGYLTEPYKVLSVVDSLSGDPVGQLTERRPETRNRGDVMLSSVYHFRTDVLYASDRWYWDDWGIRSNTVDIKYRHELEMHRSVEPHVRYYIQTRANFFRYSLLNDEPVPAFASADYRLGKLQSLTLGGTYRFTVPGRPGRWSVRAEYIRRWGDGFPPAAVGNERSLNLAPPVNVGSVVVGYTLEF